jgi:sugar lactone lactonase YvrE
MVALLVVAVAGCSSAPGDSARNDMATGGNGGGDGGTPALAIAPETLSLGVGQSVTFTANRSVSWTIAEANGGTIDNDGKYTAPLTPMTVHVQAATTDAPSEMATATVTVADFSMTIIGGTYGGPGDVDGARDTVRFETVHGLSYDGTQYVYFGDGAAVRRLDVGTGAVVTLAGRAIYWTGNVDGVGAAAKFGATRGVALDGAGALYVADSNNNTIRKLDLASRTVSTVAGAAGTPGFTNGDATTVARFNTPTGLAFDATRKLLYIADANNGAIRTYDPATQQVATLANASIVQPDGIVYDGASTLYVADAGAHQVWSVDVTTHAVAPIAGSSRGFRDGNGAAAHFDAPGPIALEGGALFVGDTLGLRKIDLSTHDVVTFGVRAGNARMITAALGDGHGSVYVFAGSDFAISKIGAPSGGTTLVAGPSGPGSGNVDGNALTSRFFDPGDLVASANAIYVSDLSNSEVRRIDMAAAMVTTVVGTPANGDVDGSGRQARMFYPTSLASDHAGTLYVVEPNSSTIRKWVASTGTMTTLAGTTGFPGADDGTGANARFDGPIAACVDGGALFVAEQSNHTVRRIDLASGAVTTLAGLGETPGRADGIGANARFDEPSGIACDGAGYVYVADALNYAIRRIAIADGTVDTVAGMLGAKGSVDMPGAAARFASPAEMTFAGGYLYVVDNGYVSLHVRKIKLGTWDVQTIATSTASGQQFYGIAVDGSGTVYVSNKEFANSTIATVASNGTLTPFAGSNATGNGLVIDGTGTAANFFGAAGMVFDGSALFVSEPQALVVRRIDPATAQVTTAIGVTPDSPSVAGTGSGAFVDHPAGLALTDASTLLVADSTSLDRIALPGASLTVAAGAVGYPGGMDGAGTAARVAPRALVSDGAGTIYFTGANSVRRYDVKSGQVDTLAGVEGTMGATDGVKDVARFYWPRGLALDGGNLYVSDTYNHTIRKVVIATGEVSTFAGVAMQFGAVDGVGDAARFALPLAIVADGKGSLFVADSENGAIRRIEIATRAVTTHAGVLGERGLQPGALPGHLNTPRGLALLPDGSLAVTDEQAVLLVH